MPHGIHLLEYDYTVTMVRNIQTWITITLLVALSDSFGDLEEINRLNYGVYMTKRQDVTVVQNFWKHTLILDIPTLTDFSDIPLPNCEFEPSCQGECLTEKSQLHDYLYQRDMANINFCPILRNETIKLNEIRTQFMTSIKDSIGSIRRLIPVIARNLTIIRTQRESRSRRALEPFNWMYKKIFGLATNSDLSALKDDFSNMHAQLRNIAQTSMQNYKDLNTFVQLTDKEIGGIKDHMQHVDSMMEILSNVTRDSNQYIDHQHLMIMSLIRDVYTIYIRRFSSIYAQTGGLL